MDPTDLQEQEIIDDLGDHLVAEMQSLVDVLQGGNAVSFANLNWCIATIFLFANLNWCIKYISCLLTYSSFIFFRLLMCGKNFSSCQSYMELLRT
jgi:hypothetical protein